MPIWTAFSVFLVWRLQREMAWKTFRKMDADLVMQHKYRTFQVLVAFLKFDAIYILEYFVRIITAISSTEVHPLGDISRWVFPMLWTILPMSFLLFLATACCVRHEHTLRTFILMAFYLCIFLVIGWFIFYLKKASGGNLSVSLKLSFYGISSASLIFCTLCTAAMCYRNFDHGLKPYIGGGKMATLLEENFEMETLRNDSSTSTSMAEA
ncbi:hypothetical protein N7533_001486 [Penicillium manginii]|uniref:uncharacterized protein n=1 Tax=Penicillium manginii TaxID=203109 RepID=UPI0025493F73|nr:uncharacterized protein N7533_001486 [Penicillium manginii]KAJ5762805.1 hypothetical protein N7533_001486 [Penicillium manginii]